MAESRSQFGVAMMARILGVSRSGFYEWLKREPSPQSRRRETVGEAVESTFRRCKRRYGAPRLTRALNALGVECSENYVAKLLRARSLRAHNGKGFRHERAVESSTQVKQNVLARNFASEGPNRKVGLGHHLVLSRYPAGRLRNRSTIEVQHSTESLTALYPRALR
jgi:putative transposase